MSSLPAVRRCRAVITIHDLAPLIWPEHYLRLPYSRVGHAWAYALARKADAIIAVSNALAAKRTRQAWEATVKRMAEKSPPAFSAEEISLITAYLTLVVGAE